MILERLKNIDYEKLIKDLLVVLHRYRDRVIIAIFMVVFAVILSIVTTKDVTNKNEQIDEYDGIRFVTEIYPIFKDVVFIGDSYAHQLALELGFDTTIYSSPGLTLSELKYCFKSAKGNQKKYVVIFIGPNDFKEITGLESFTAQLTAYVDMFVEDSKVILCSYLSSLYTESLEDIGVHPRISEYDDEIKRVSNLNNKVYYFDINDLSGKVEYLRYNYDKNNNKFYVEFINRLYKFISSIG